MRWAWVFLIVPISPLLADTIFAARTIPARSIITASDLTSVDMDIAGHASTFEQAIGFEAMTTIYADRPIPLNQLESPAIVERNQMISLVFNRNGLEIETEGRSLDRGGIGARVRVMNQASRNTVSGVIDADGRVIVGRGR